MAEQPKSNPNQQPPAAHATREQWPSGFVYVEDFLSPEEQQRVIDIIEYNGFDQHVHRRQQFFGPTYYHTPQSYRAALQPVDTTLATEVLGNDNDNTENSKGNTNTNDTTPDTINNNAENKPEEQQQPQDGDSVKVIGAKNMRHDISQFKWLIDKLIAQRLFERADVRDPLVEYINENDGIKRVQRHLIPKDTDPLFVRELEKLTEIQRLEAETGTTAPWGEDTPYPDQILVNEYTVNQNIGLHFDDALCFGPLVVGVSCGSDCTLILSRPQCIGHADKYLRELHDKQQQYQCKSNESNNNDNDNNTNNTTTNIPDIEDLDKEYIKCHTDDFYDIPQQQLLAELEAKKERGEITQTEYLAILKNNELSYPISLRDFTKPSWREGPGHPLLHKYCRCTRERVFKEKHQFGKFLLNIKRQQELQTIKKYPDIADVIINQMYGTETFYNEYVTPQVDVHTNKVKTYIDEFNSPDQQQQQQATTNNNNNQYDDYEPSVTHSTTHSTTNSHNKNQNARKKAINTEALTKHFDWFQKRYETNRAKALAQGLPPPLPEKRDLTQYPQYIQDLIELIFSTDDFPTTEEEMNAFIMSYDFEKLLEIYYTSPNYKHDQQQIVNSSGSNNNSNNNGMLSLSKIRSNLIDLLTPNLVDINTCTHTDDTLYLPVKKGSVYVLAGASRYQYRHAIKKLSRTEQKNNPDYRRVSLTVRSLMPGRRQVQTDSSFDHDLSQYNYFKGNNTTSDSSNNNNTEISTTPTNTQHDNTLKIPPVVPE